MNTIKFNQLSVPLWGLRANLTQPFLIVNVTLIQGVMVDI